MSHRDIAIHVFQMGEGRIEPVTYCTQENWKAEIHFTGNEKNKPEKPTIDHIFQRIDAKRGLITQTPNTHNPETSNFWCNTTNLIIAWHKV